MCTAHPEHCLIDRGIVYPPFEPVTAFRAVYLPGKWISILEFRCTTGACAPVMLPMTASAPNDAIRTEYVLVTVPPLFLYVARSTSKLPSVLTSAKGSVMEDPSGRVPASGILPASIPSSVCLISAVSFTFTAFAAFSALAAPWDAVAADAEADDAMSNNAKRVYLRRI